MIEEDAYHTLVQMWNPFVAIWMEFTESIDYITPYIPSLKRWMA